MRWVKLTAANDIKPMWVNLDRICQMTEGEFVRLGETCTRLFSGHMGYTADLGCASIEFFTIDVVQRPDQILEIAGAAQDKPK